MSLHAPSKLGSDVAFAGTVSALQTCLLLAAAAGLLGCGNDIVGGTTTRGTSGTGSGGSGTGSGGSGVGSGGATGTGGAMVPDCGSLSSSLVRACVDLPSSPEEYNFTFTIDGTVVKSEPATPGATCSTDHFAAIHVGNHSWHGAWEESWEGVQHNGVVIDIASDDGLTYHLVVDLPGLTTGVISVGDDVTLSGVRDHGVEVEDPITAAIEIWRASQLQLFVGRSTSDLFAVEGGSLQCTMTEEYCRYDAHEMLVSHGDATATISHEASALLGPFLVTNAGYFVTSDFDGGACEWFNDIFTIAAVRQP